MSVLKKIVNMAKDDVWEVRRTIWPYPDGWGTYNPGARTVLDTGLSREEAQARCDALNAEESK